MSLRHNAVTAAGDKIIFLQESEVHWLLASDLALTEWFERSTIVKEGDKIAAAVLEEANVFIKQYKAVGLLQQLRSILGFSRAKRVFNISCRLVEAGVPVAKPILLGEKNGILANESYYACRLFGEHCVDLKALYFSEQWQCIDQERLLVSIATSMANMHSASLCHGDMKWSNIVVQADGKAFWFVDLDGARATMLNKKDSGRDLARFLVNVEEFGLDQHLRQSFLLSYAAARQASVVEVEAWYQSAYNKLAARHRVKYQSKI